MKLSDLIGELVAIAAAYGGDLPVMYADSFRGDWTCGIEVTKITVGRDTGVYSIPEDLEVRLE